MFTADLALFDVDIIIRIDFVLFAGQTSGLCCFLSQNLLA